MNTKQTIATPVAVKVNKVKVEKVKVKEVKVKEVKGEQGEGEGEGATSKALRNFLALAMHRNRKH